MQGKTVVPQIPGANLPFVVNSHDILNGKVSVDGNVVVIGGGMAGMEVAEYLAQRGCKVTDLEMMKEFCADLGMARKSCVTESIYQEGIIPGTESDRLIFAAGEKVISAKTKRSKNGK